MLAVRNYFSLIKFAHTIFAMPFALIGFFLGLRAVNYQTYKPWWFLLALVVLCMVFVRSAAMAFNRWLDAEFDGLNARTAIREISSGIITKKKAMTSIVFNCIAFLITIYFIYSLCMLLSPVALFVILFSSYT